MKEIDILRMQGRSSIFLRLFLVTLVITIVSELIGKIIFSVGPGKVVFLPMLYAVIIGLVITPDLLGKVIQPLKKAVGGKEIQLAGPAVMLALLPLGVKYGTLVGPNIEQIIAAGPAFLLQELGNLLTILIAMPFALWIGMKREAFGATVSICREPTLGVIGERYGINSPEGTGTLATYLCGSVFGTIFFGLLGSMALLTGLHPYALAMATGVGSGSMMASASASLAAAADPAMSNTILAYAATSNMLTGITGLWSVIFIAIPAANWYYRKLAPVFGADESTDHVKTVEAK